MTNLHIEPPLGGIHRAFGYQKQPQYTAIDIMNMWPFNAADGRAVLATRPPLTAILSPGTGVNGGSLVTSGGAKPQEGIVLFENGDLSYWSGTAWVPATGAQQGTIDSTGQVAAAPHVKYVVIPNGGTPLIYDYSANTLVTLVATAGTAPTGCTVVWNHMGSITMSGKSGQETVLFSARTGDPFDWDFTDTDEGAAFETTAEFGGLVNGPVSAGFMISDDTSIIGTPNGMYAMRGHLSRGGIIDQISTKHGILGPYAWCVANGKAYCMSKGGLATMNDSQVTLVSDKKMPDQLRGIVYDYDAPNISMAYDSRWDVIYIAITGDQAQAWMYHIPSGGFQRMRFASYPTVIITYDPFMSFNRSGVLWCGTGYGGLARFDRLGVEDDQPGYWAFIGPIALSPDYNTKGKIRKMRAVLGANSNDPAGVFAVYTGTDGEDAFVRAFNNLPSRRYVVSHETLQRNAGTCYPHLAGAAEMIVVSGQGGKVTILEGIDQDIDAMGLNRDLRMIGWGYDFSGGLDDYDPGIGGGFNAQFGDNSEPTYGNDAEITDPGDTSNPQVDDGGSGHTGTWDDGDSPWDTSPVNPTANSGYATFSLAASPGETLTDFTHFLPLALITSDAWWAAVSTTGGDLRATDASNVQLPLHVLAIDKTARTGLVATKLTQAGAADLRLWSGTGFLSQPPFNHTFGRDNVYTTYAGFWPTGSGADQSGNNHTLSILNGTPAATTGFIAGVQATRYVGDEGTETDTDTVSTPLAVAVPLSIIGYAKRNVAGVIDHLGFFTLEATTPSQSELHFGSANVTAISTNAGGSDTATATAALAVGTWGQISGVFASSTSRRAALNATAGTDTASRAVGTSTIFAGGAEVSASDASLGFLQVHAAARSANWLAAQGSMILTPAVFFDPTTYTATPWPN